MDLGETDKSVFSSLQRRSPRSTLSGSQRGTAFRPSSYMSGEGLEGPIVCQLLGREAITIHES